MRRVLASLLLLGTLFQDAVHADITQAMVVPTSLSAGVRGAVSVSFISGVDVAVGGAILVQFPSVFRIDPAASVTLLSTGSTTLSMASASSSQISVQVGTTKISAGVAFAFSISDVTNPAAQTTADFSITSYDPASVMLETDTAVSGVAIVSTTLSSAAVAPDSLTAGVTGQATVSFTSAVGLPVGSVVTVTFPSDFTVVSTAISSVSEIDISSTVFMASVTVVAVTVGGSAVAAGSNVSFKIDSVTNPGASTSGVFALATTDSQGFVFESSRCSAVTIVPGSLSDAKLTPQFAHPGIVSTVDISYTASAALAKDSLLIISLPVGDYAASAMPISVDVVSPLGITATASWNSASTSIRVLLTSAKTIQSGDSVLFRVAALDMPPSIRSASNTTATIASWNHKGVQLDGASPLSLCAITAVQGFLCSWVTEISNPGITSNVLVTFKTNGRIPIGGKITLAIPTSDFFAFTGSSPSIVFKFPATVVASSAWNASTGILELVISNDVIPAYSTGVQFHIMQFDTPISVRSGLRQPASLTTFDSEGAQIDGPGDLQLDGINAGHISGSRMWTAENPVTGVMSDQIIVFSINGKMDPGGRFEFTLPDTQWTMAATSVATFTSPNLGNVGALVWNESTRMMTITLGGTVAIAAYTEVKLRIPAVANPPKETGINNAYLTTRTADGSIIDGSDTITVMTISRGALTGALTWTSVTTASASMLSDQRLCFTLNGALPSGSIVLITLPSGGWRMADNNSVMASFSQPVSGVAVQSATWDPTASELRIVPNGSLDEHTPIELLIRNMINPFSKAPSDMCKVTTMLPDLGVVDESTSIAVNTITSSTLSVVGAWTSTIATPGVLSAQTVTFTTGGRLEIGATFCVTMTDMWSFMASTAASLTLGGSTQTSPVVFVFNGINNTVCVTSAVSINQGTGVTIVFSDVLSPESIRTEQIGSLLILSHLGGDVNVGTVRFNAVQKGVLSEPLTWQPLFFSPGPVAGLLTSARLQMTITGQITARGRISVALPSEWILSSSCVVAIVRPSVRCSTTCNSSTIDILLLDSISTATPLDISVTGVYNPPVVIPAGLGSAATFAVDGGEIDETTAIITGKIVAAVTGVANSGDHLVAVVGVVKTFSLLGSSLAENDVVKFVDASTTSDANCGVSTTGQSDVGGISVKYLSGNQDISVKFTQSSPNGQPFAICYKFGDNPFKLYSTFSITVKEITSITTDVGLANVAVANFAKTWSFNGNGIMAGDQVRWINLDVVESAAFVSTPPDCLDTSTLAKLAPPAAGALTIPEDDYTRTIKPMANISFALSPGSSGSTFCLCYKFGNEPFVVYPSIKVTVSHIRSIQSASTGSDDVAVVDAPKSFTFLGDGLSLNDGLYFVEMGSVSFCAESNIDTSLQMMHLINNQVQSRLFIDSNFAIQVNFNATAAGKKVVPCYQFGMEPYQLYPNIRLTVKMITGYTGTLGSPQLTVASVAEPLIFLGYGLAAGDQVRWILRGEYNCETSLSTVTEPTTLTLIDTTTLDSNNTALFNFTSTQIDYNPVLCYKFGEEKFKLYTSISIAIGTVQAKSVTEGAKDVAVVGNRKMFTLVGTNLAEGDRVGWISTSDSTAPCANLSLLIPNPATTDSDYLSYLTNTSSFGVSVASLSSGKRLHLCYGFGQEPFKLFRDLYVDVKSITNLRALVGSPNVVVAGATKTFLFDGDGVATGDFAKFVSNSSSDCSSPGIQLMNIMKEYDNYDEMAMYLYGTAGGVTTGIFQINSDNSSVGLARVLCYRFGVEPFTYYENFKIDVKTIWALRRVDKAASGQDNVIVVNEPKLMTIDGVGVSVKDTLKFVNATSGAGDRDCPSLPPQGQDHQQLRVTTELTVSLPFDYGSQGGQWTLCYKFDDEPFRLYPSVSVTVKEITALLDYSFQDTAGLGGVATIGHLKQWKPVGSGILAGDTVKVVPGSVVSSVDCGLGDANIAGGTIVMTVAGFELFFSGTIATFPSSISDVYHVCYRFQDEPFSYVRDFTLTTFGIIGLDRNVVLMSSITAAKVSGFRISDTDRMGWTTNSTNCGTVLGLTEVTQEEVRIIFTESYAQLFMCYSFNRQPFDVFKTVTLSIVKAEIWTPKTVSIIADQTSKLIVWGTFGITQGIDQIGWVPSDVVGCSTESTAKYANVLQTSVISVTKSETIMPRAGGATFSAKFVAPAGGSGVTATDSFSTWKLCYRFGNSPNFLIFGGVICSVFNIAQIVLVDLKSSSTGATMKFEFDGAGLQDFDSAKWVDASVASVDADCNTLPGIGGSTVSDVVSARATFAFAEQTSAMALCYKFQGHAFKLYSNLPIQDATATAANLGQSTIILSTSYGEEAAAAASDQFTPNRDVATVSLTLDKDISEIPPGSSAETAFKSSFVAALATSLGIDPSRIQITELAEGSVVVRFQLLPSDTTVDPTVSEAVRDLQTQLQDTSSALLANSAIVVKNTPMALSVTVTTAEAPSTTSAAFQALGYQPNGLFSFVKTIYSLTEKSSQLVIPVVRLQGTASAVSISVQVDSGTTAIYGKDYTFPASTTFDSNLNLVYLRFEIDQALQTFEIDILDDSVKGVYFESLKLVLLDPELSGAALGATQETNIRIYDYDDGVALVMSSFGEIASQSTTEPDALQGWQVVANGASPLRVDVNGVFAVDDVFGEAEYNQKCDLASPTGVCTYSCEVGGGLGSLNAVESDYNALHLDGDDFVATMSGITPFPSEEFTVSVWVRTLQTDPNACIYSYAMDSDTSPTVPLALCNPSNLQLYINADSNASGLSTFVNISDNSWHFVAITWSSDDGRVRLFDNGMLAFDGGPYRGGKMIESNGFLVVGSLVLSSATLPPCSVSAEFLALIADSSASSLAAIPQDVSCNAVTGSGFQGQIQHVHVWSRVLPRSELLKELSWPLQGRAVSDLSMQENIGVVHCESTNSFSLSVAPITVANIPGSVDGCLLHGEVPRLDDEFPCGPVFANIWYFSAPPTFISQLKNAYGGRLQFRLLAPSFNGSPRPRRGQVSIFGTTGDGEATQISVSLGSFALPSASRWTYYSVVLREDFAWITEPDGLQLTGLEMQAVLENASALWIRGDIWAYDTTGAGQEVVYLNDIALYAK